MAETTASVATSAGKLEPCRFAFGKNWQRFLSLLDDERIAEAEKSLCMMLGVEDLRGKSWLDVGSGSGLFSLAAMRLGASRVYSFDYDPQSVACTQELKQRYFPGNAHWVIEQGSILDKDYLAGLGNFDVVYSWVFYTTRETCGRLWKTRALWSVLAAGFLLPFTTMKAAVQEPGGQSSNAILPAFYGAYQS